MALITEDRKQTGLNLIVSVKENIASVSIGKLSNHGIVNDKKINEVSEKYIKELKIKTPDGNAIVGNLSGGNQQKVILGRWLMTEPDFLILDEPTRGIDVGTKTEIQKLVVKLANEGMSVVFISSEVEEMLRTVTHMGILRDGEKVGELEESELSQENVMKAIAGGDK